MVGWAGALAADQSAGCIDAVPPSMLGLVVACRWRGESWETAERGWESEKGSGRVLNRCGEFWETAGRGRESERGSWRVCCLIVWMR